MMIEGDVIDRRRCLWAVSCQGLSVRSSCNLVEPDGAGDEIISWREMSGHLNA